MKTPDEYTKFQESTSISLHVTYTRVSRVWHPRWPEGQRQPELRKKEKPPPPLSPKLTEYSASPFWCRGKKVVSHWLKKMGTFVKCKSMWEPLTQGFNSTQFVFRQNCYSQNPGGGGGYSNLIWVRRCGPKFWPKQKRHTIATYI